MELTAYITLNKSLAVTEDCLDKEFDIKINGFLGKLVTPHDEGILVFGNHYVLSEPITKLMIGRKIIWGEYSRNGPVGFRSFKILFEINDEIFLEKSNELFRAIPEWLNRLKLNFSFYGQNLNAPTSMEEPESGMYDLLYLDQDGRQKHPHTVSSATTVFLSTRRLGFEKLQEVFECTSRNLQPILELRLLFQSHVALLLGDYRRSILDSATSLEVTLSRLLTLRLNVNEVLLNEILRKFNSIWQRLDLLKKIGVKLENVNSYHEVGRLRNSSIHAGREPSKEQARKAFQIVDRFVREMLEVHFEPIDKG